MSRENLCQYCRWPGLSVVLGCRCPSMLVWVEIDAQYFVKSFIITKALHFFPLDCSFSGLRMSVFFLRLTVSIVTPFFFIRTEHSMVLRGIGYKFVFTINISTCCTFYKKFSRRFGTNKFTRSAPISDVPAVTFVPGIQPEKATYSVSSLGRRAVPFI